jgi:hypothetical protein
MVGRHGLIDDGASWGAHEHCCLMQVIKKLGKEVVIDKVPAYVPR